MPQNELLKFYDNLITIYRETKQKDGFGGSKKTWTKLSWEVPCRIYAANRGQMFQIGLTGDQYTVTEKMAISTDVDIQVSDRLEDKDGNFFTVIKLNKKVRFKDIHHLECYLAKYDGRKIDES